MTCHNVLCIVSKNECRAGAPSLIDSLVLTLQLWVSLQGADGSTRAFNSFAIKTQDLEPGTCSLEVLDYFDMRGWFPV